jgi:agmatinase
MRLFVTLPAFAEFEPQYRDLETAHVVIIPVPYQASPRQATSQGPQAVFAASRTLDLFDEELGYEPYRVGIATVPEFWDEPPFARTEQATAQVLKMGKFPILVGGEQALSIGAIRAAWKQHPKLYVVHVDARLDLVLGEDPYASRSAMARVHALGIPLVQVGIRALSMDESQWLSSPTGQGQKVFWAKDFVDYCPAKDAAQAWDMHQVVEAIPKGAPVFLNVDLHGLDPSMLPAIYAPVPGGITWYPMLRLLRHLCENRNVVAADFLELMPMVGQEQCDALVARLIYKLIGYRFSAAQKQPASKAKASRSK